MILTEKTKPQKFTADKPHVIVCEGIDDKKFLEEYLKYLSENSKLNSELFNIFKTDGVDGMIKGMKLFKNYGKYEDMKSFLFIRDADQAVEKNTEIHFRTRHKNRLNLLFGSTNEFVGDKLGEAAKKKCF